MNNKIELLDHGFVRLVSYMQPVPLPDNEPRPIDWNGDLEISRNARVSYDAEGRPEDEKLINYLYTNGHNTPFESMTFTFEVKAPIFVFRQWHRHRTQSYNELSARYRELPEEFYIPEPHLVGQQNKDNKQMRNTMTAEEFYALREDQQVAIQLKLESMNKHNQAAFKLYREMLADGMPRELARSVLPVATYSHMFATVNLNNLFKFISERSHEHAQYEIRVYSDALLKLIEPIVPAAVKAFENNL